MNPVPEKLALSILVVPNENELNYTAHCLELDLIGLGNSPGEAIRELAENISTQIESCKTHGAKFFVPAHPCHQHQFNFLRKRHGTEETP